MSDEVCIEKKNPSIFGLIYTYNVLPQHVVDSRSVSIFQSHLQEGLRQVVSRNIVNWESFYSSGFKHVSVHAFQSLFNERVVNDRRNRSALSVPFFQPSTDPWW